MHKNTSEKAASIRRPADMRSHQMIYDMIGAGVLREANRGRKQNNGNKQKGTDLYYGLVLVKVLIRYHLWHSGQYRAFALELLHMAL